MCDMRTIVLMSAVMRCTRAHASCMMCVKFNCVEAQKKLPGEREIRPEVRHG